MPHDICSECQSREDADALFVVDGQQVCRRCLFGTAAPVTIYPIGTIVNDQERDASAFGRRGDGGTSRIELAPGQRRFMHGLAAETHLTVVYYLHQSRPVRSRFARGWDGKEVGVFASRTPDRLSRLAIQDVELLEVQDNVLIVGGLDAINGSPVLDIKMCRHRK